MYCDILFRYIMIFADLSSPWLVIAPALIAGSIGLISAALSYRAGSRSLTVSAAIAERGMDHERDLLVVGRRMDAIETAWKVLFELEQSKGVGDAARDALVRAVVWLPSDVRHDLLQAILEAEDGVVAGNVLTRARQGLLSISKTKEEARVDRHG